MKHLTGLRAPIKDLEGNVREELVLNGRGEPVLRDGKEQIWRSFLPGRLIAQRLHAATTGDAMLLDKLARLFYNSGDEISLEDAEFAVAQSAISEDSALFPWAKVAILTVFTNAKTVARKKK